MVFAEHLHENILLAHPHRHITFSLPKRLRIYFRYDRTLFKHLYRAAWETWNNYVSEQLSDGQTGAVMALHPAGDLLNWNPHLHCVALDGVLLDDSHFLQLRDIHNEALSKLFSEKVFDMLLQKELISREIVAFLHNAQEIERIAQNLGYVTWRAPPPFVPASREPFVDTGVEFSQVIQF